MIPLRIMMVTNNYTPYSGGVVSSIDVFASELEKLGHTVIIVTLDFLGPKHADPCNVIRIPCILRFIYKKNHMAIPLRAQHHLRKAIEKFKPDIIHSHHPTLLGAAARKVAKKLHIPCIFTYHTLYEFYAHYVPLAQSLVRYCIKKAVRSYCKRVNGIIVPTASLRRSLECDEIETPACAIATGLHPPLFDQFS